MIRPRRAFLGLCGGGLVWLASVSTATGHAIIVASVPGADETVATPPPYLVLRFNGRIEEKFSSVTLVGANKTTIQLFSREAAQRDTLTYRMPPLGPGRYQANWRVLSTDGHITEGVLSFTVATPPPPK